MSIEELEDWYVVWTPARRGRGGKPRPIAAFASKDMACDWIMEYTHRSKYIISRLVKIENTTVVTQPLIKP